MITLMHVGAFVLGVGGSVILTVLFYWIKQLKLKKKTAKLAKEVFSLTEKERNEYLKNGGNITISDKEVKDSERFAELRRRKLLILRELEARERGIKKQTYEFGDSNEDSGRFYVSSMDSNIPREWPESNGRDVKEPTRDNKKIRFSSSEEF